MQEIENAVREQALGAGLPFFSPEDGEAGSEDLSPEMDE
jgi:hypothetical protein